MRIHKKAAAALLLAVLTALLLTSCGRKNAAANDAAPLPEGSISGSAADSSEQTGTAASLEEQLKLAWNFLTEGNYQEAVLAFTAVIDIDQKNGDAYRGRAEAYLGLAGAGDGDFAQYLALAAGDYDQAALYLGDGSTLADARKDRNRALYQACMAKAHAAMEAGDIPEMFEQMRRASMVEGSVDFGDEEISVWYSEYLPFIQGTGDTDTILAFHQLLMEMTVNSGLSYWNSSPWLQLLHAQLTGYQDQVYVTREYIETIDRPMTEFVRAHEEYQDCLTALQILYHGSIALGDLETAAETYPRMTELILAGQGNTDPSRTYTYREDGYSWTGSNREGYRQTSCEFDIYGRCTSRTDHSEPYDGPNASIPSATDEVWSYEYESAGPRLLKSVETITNERGTSAIERSYTYEDGRLVRLEELYTRTGETAVTEYSYQGMDATVTYTSTRGEVRTEEKAVHYAGHMLVGR